MSFFSWFSAKPTAVKNVPAVNHANRAAPAKGAAPVKLAGGVTRGVNLNPAPTPTPNGNVLSVERKVKRQVRREQLYSVIRESMTRAGLLSASYKFKVLSLDQKGNQFLVMMDVAPELSTGPEKLTQTEALLIQSANATYSIKVTAVYWRTDHPATATAAASPPEAIQTPASYSTEDGFAQTQANPLAALREAQARSVGPSGPSGAISSAKPGHDPLLEAEVAAFKRALAVPVQTPPNAALLAANEADKAERADKSNKVDKGRTGLRSYTLITGFEDTEMPDSPAIPALSNTQYGDLK